MSVWADIQDRSNGDLERKEDQSFFVITSCEGGILFRDKGRVVSMWDLTYWFKDLDEEISIRVDVEGEDKEVAKKTFLDIAESVKSKYDDVFDDEINDELDMISAIQVKMLEWNNSIIYK